MLAAGWFGATAVFLMRANGLYTRFFLDYLDLETMEPDVKYVAKVSRLEDLEGKKGLTWQAILAGLGLAGVFGFAFGGGSEAAMGKDFILGVGVRPVGHRRRSDPGWTLQLLFEAFKDSMAWFGAVLLSSNTAGSRTFSSARWPSCSRRSCRSFMAE